MVPALVIRAAALAQTDKCKCSRAPTVGSWQLLDWAFESFSVQLLPGFGRSLISAVVTDEKGRGPVVANPPCECESFSRPPAGPRLAKYVSPPIILVF